MVEENTVVRKNSTLSILLLFAGIGLFVALAVESAFSPENVNIGEYQFMMMLLILAQVSNPSRIYKE